MGVSIIHIKRPLWRRVVLVVVFVPVVFITIIWETMKNIVEMIDEAPRAFKSAWRGYH